MPTQYLIWKWAANDQPGHMPEIVDQLATGDLPVALRPFPVRQVYGRLFQVRQKHEAELSEIFVDPCAEGGLTRYIRFRHPLGGSAELANQLLWAVWEAELTVYNATDDRLIGLPKRNVVEYPGGRQFVDITVGDIPGLLHELGAEPELAALACYDKDGNMFQVWAYGRHYAVEWQILPGRDFSLHRIWLAGRTAVPQRQTRLGTVECGLNLFAQELLGIAEVHQLWMVFLSGGGRPASHAWRDVTRQLDHPGQPTRYRHTKSISYPHERSFGSN